MSLDGVVNASISDFFGNRYAQAWWAETRERWGPQLIAAVDAHAPSVSAQQDSIYYARVRDRLQSEGR